MYLKKRKTRKQLVSAFLLGFHLKYQLCEDEDTIRMVSVKKYTINYQSILQSSVLLLLNDQKKPERLTQITLQYVGEPQRYQGFIDRILLSFNNGNCNSMFYEARIKQIVTRFFWYKKKVSIVAFLFLHNVAMQSWHNHQPIPMAYNLTIPWHFLPESFPEFDKYPAALQRCTAKYRCFARYFVFRKQYPRVLEKKKKLKK